MSSKNPHVWIFTPSYLDVESFLTLREKIREQIQRISFLKGMALRFVLIDDSGGSDRELDRVRNFEDVEVLSTPFNLGHQRAIVYGLRKFAKFIKDEDLVITLDADGEDKPEDLQSLCEPFQKNPENLKLVVLARRTKRKESLPFKILYFCFRLLFRSMTGVLVRTGNYAMYRGWVAKNVLFHPHFDLCYSSSLISLSLDTVYVPCERGSRYSGQSKMSYIKLIIHGVRMLMPFLDRIAVRALIFFSALFGLSFGLVLAMALNWKLQWVEVPGWMVAAAVVIAGSSVVAIGNFVILFAVFSQTQGLSLHHLDRPASLRPSVEDERQPEVYS